MRDVKHERGGVWMGWRRPLPAPAYPRAASARERGSVAHRESDAFSKPLKTSNFETGRGARQIFDQFHESSAPQQPSPNRGSSEKTFGPCVSILALLSTISKQRVTRVTFYGGLLTGKPEKLE